MSKVILVTGANTGIGFELVRLLAEKGHTVYLGARNEHAGKVAECVLILKKTDMACLHTHEFILENSCMQRGSRMLNLCVLM